MWLAGRRKRVVSPSPCGVKSGIAGILTLFLLEGCEGPEVEEVSLSGSVVVGRVLEDQTKLGVRYARVSLMAPQRVRLVLSREDGTFSIAGVPPTKYRLRVARAGFAESDVEVPAGMNDTSSVVISLQRNPSIPPIKPLSQGPVRINLRVLEEDFDRNGAYRPLRVQGVAFSPAPIGSGGNVPQGLYDRCADWLDSLHVNTIRTYSGIDPTMLARASDHRIKVIVGFWVQTSYNLADPIRREELIGSFRSFVRGLKDSPAILMWNVGNEQNLPFNNGDNPYWYDLVQELAITAFEVEGATYHPVCASNGDFTNIGNPAKRADDASLSYMDLWASNIYRFDLGASFASYRTRTNKPVVLTEFGIDALDHRTKREYEAVQAEFDSTNWMQILAASDVCVGGTLFEFTDEWWKAGNPDSHDFGGYATDNHPDGYSNEEWWGLISLSPDADGDGRDEWRPRKAFRMFQQQWR